MNSEAERHLLSWVHLSDIHFGQGGVAEKILRSDIRTQLLQDALKLCTRHKISLQFGLLSGDLFQRGGMSTGEIKELDQFADGLISALILKDGLYCIPGNHDVQRLEINDRNIRRLLYEAKTMASNEKLDDYLAIHSESEMLRSRFKEYESWIQKRGANKNVKEGSPLAWERTWIFDEAVIRLQGLNSAWLCTGDGDKGMLQVPFADLLLGASASPEEIGLLALHHPINWLRRPETIQEIVLRDFKVLLTGHVHDASTSSFGSAKGKELISVSAGAMYEPSDHEHLWANAKEFRYSVCSIVLETSGSIAMYQWPRRWTKSREFGLDVDLIPEGSDHSRWLLKPAKLSPMRSACGGFGSHFSLVDAIERFGARRTAFPTDLSMAELANKELLVAPVFTSIDCNDYELCELAEKAANGKHLLILGSPGSGKSVALYSMALRLRELGMLAVPITFSELRSEFTTSGVGLGLSTMTASPSTVVIVDGLDEASISDSAGPDGFADWLGALGRKFTVIISCRREEYEQQQLSVYLAKVNFPYVAHLKPWRLEVEFADFIRRLVSGGNLSDQGLLDIASENRSVGELCTNPLFARMLGSIGGDGAKSIASVEDLYGGFFRRLAQRSQKSLAEANCYLGIPVERLWSSAAWHSFRLSLVEDERLNYRALLLELAPGSEKQNCVSRALSEVIDLGSDAWRQAPSYIHYSFYEFHLAVSLEAKITGLAPLEQDGESIEVLSRDIPRRVRHFLVNLLKRNRTAHAKMQLLNAFRLLRAERPLDQSRTVCNSIIYILSRVFECGPELNELLAVEQDIFIRDSLFWGLSHRGDIRATETFIKSLCDNGDHGEVCRGYLLYYHGDLALKAPPFLDREPFIRWSQARGAIFELISSEAYAENVSLTRQVIDLYTFMDLARVRNEYLETKESDIIRSRIGRISDDGTLPDWISELLNLLFARILRR